MDYLKPLVEKNTLAEIYIEDVPEMKVGVLLSVTEKELGFIEINPSGHLIGLLFCYLDDVEIVKTETLYLEELQKNIDIGEVTQQISLYQNQISDLSFKGLIQYCKQNQQLIEVTGYQERTWAGRVVDSDTQVLILDEYYTEHDRRLARCYIDWTRVRRIAIDVPWLKTIARSLADKNI